MSKIYNVPAIEKAHKILNLIAEHPSKLRFIDIVNLTSMHKSHVFSLLKTMTNLGWIKLDTSSRYEIGTTISLYSSFNLFNFDIVKKFYQLTQNTLCINNLEATTLQLAILDNTSVLYLAKIESKLSTKIPSYPGLKLPAHSTAMGKVLLSQYDKKMLRNIYPNDNLEKVTPNTVGTFEELCFQLEDARINGFVIEVGEAILGYSCAAAPIYNAVNKICAAISLTTIVPYPSNTHDEAIEIICSLAKEISNLIKE